MAAVARRLVAPSVGLTGFALMAALYASGHTVAYAAILRGWGMFPFGFPFLDTAGNLAAWDCARQGQDVIGFNPCDILGRSFNYGPLWQDLTFIPFYPIDRPVVGTVLDVLFLVALAALPPPADWRGAGVMALATLSTAVVFALERANPDLLIYLLLVPLPASLARFAPARALGYALVWITAGLKFYPVALLALALRERPRCFWLLVALSAALLGAYLLRYHHELARILPLLPTGNYDSDLFAAKNLPMRLGRVTELATGSIPAALIAGGVIVALLLARATRQMRRLLENPDVTAALRAMPERTHLHLLCGSLLIVFCFLAGQNIAYRAIFLLFALPGLMSLARADSTRRLGARLTRATLFLMWEGCFRNGLHVLLAASGLDQGTAFMIGFVYWVFRELLWWWLVAALFAIILRFAWDSPMRSTLWPRGN